jgi:peptidoglycan/LPS O-acetylase OafA/YrhL
VAVVLVVAFHAGFPALNGGYIGVDVFYVISGFLITGLLFEEVERTGTIDFAAFYARRARRLLPMALLVLAAVAVGMLFLTPPVFRPQVRFDAISAALYYSNWQFALESVNYLTLGGAQNPVLHYWSLSVEEQFYLAWPLLLFAAVRFGRRGAGAARRIRWGAVVAIAGGCSLAYSVIATPAQPAIAYFATTTRVWEFAVGAGVALLAPCLPRVPRVAAIALGVAGLATVVTSAFVYSPTTEFPGTAAIAPVLGAAVVIAAGFAGPLGGVGALLALPPLRYVGRISYALYLWHWPCLVFASTSRWAPPDGRIGWLATIAAVALAFALAATTHRFVEVPMRHATWLASGRRVLLFAATATAAAILAVGIAGGPLSLSETTSGLLGDADASVIAPTAVTPLEAEASTPYAALHGCHVGYSATAPAPACVFGDVAAQRTVVLLGDSHAAQWFPALSELAVREHFRLISWTKSGCPFTLGVHIFLPAIGRDYNECVAWQTAVVRKLRALPRTAMIIVGRTSTYLPQVLTADGDTPDSSHAAGIWGAGMAKSVTVLRQLTARVVVLRDTPHAPFDVPACISWDSDAPASRCSFRRSADGHSDDAEYAAERTAGVPVYVYANPTPAVCPAAICPAVFDGEITYRDDNHLTAKFVALRWRQFAASLHGSFVKRQI